MASEEPLKYTALSVSGRMITSADPVQLGQGDFQSLSNMRYTNQSPQSIHGMSKINTSALAKPIPGAAVHLVKDAPAENHIVAQGISADRTSAALYANTAAIPAQGAFSSIYSLSGPTAGRFSNAPDGCVAFGNGTDLLVWGGNESRCAAFVVANELDTLRAPTLYWDYTSEVNDGSDTTTASITNSYVYIASTRKLKGIKFYIGSANTIAGTAEMFYWAGSSWTTVGSPSDGTIVAGKPLAQTGTFSFTDTSSVAKLKYFNGILAYWYLWIGSSTAELLTNGQFTTDIAGWTGANWAWNASGGGSARHTAGSVAALSQAAATVTAGVRYEIVYAVNSRTAGSLTPSCGGVTGTTASANGSYVFAFTATATTAIAFTPTTDFDGDITGASMHVLNNATIKQCTVDAQWQKPTDIWDGVPRQIAGFGTITSAEAVIDKSLNIYAKDYVDGSTNTYFETILNPGGTLVSGTDIITNGTFTSDITGWSGTNWAWNAASTGVARHTAGSTQAIEQSTATVRIGAQYRLTFSVKNTTAGSLTPSCGGVTGSTYANGTAFTYDFTATATTALAFTPTTDFDGDLDDVILVNLDTISQYVIVGFVERMMAMRLYLPQTNKSAANTLYVDYWNGSAWTALTTSDGTSEDSVTLAKDGVVSWNDPGATVEKTRTLGSQDLFYCYRIRTSIDTTTIIIDYISGIPLGATLEPWKFPAMFQNRLVLCNNQASESNAVLIGGANTSSVFSGSDSTRLYFGDNRGINGAIPFFSRFSNNFFEHLIVFKPDSVWVIDGTSPLDYRTYRMTSINGLAAPATLTACDIGFTGVPGTDATRNVLIWQSANAICMFEGSVVIPIHADIENVFDQTKAGCIEPTMIHKSTAFFDEVNREWHWLWASKDNTTSLDKEYVYDIIRRKWYTIDRGSGNRLQIGLSVMDTNNLRYSYGFTYDGYMKRLEYGNAFDSTAIVSVLHTGDVPLAGWNQQSEVRRVKPLMKAKNTTSNSMQLSYYGDCATTATKTLTYPVANSTGRIVKAAESTATSGGYGHFVFHSFKCSMTTSDETLGFEPLGIGVFYKEVRPDLK